MIFKNRNVEKKEKKMAIECALTLWLSIISNGCIAIKKVANKAILFELKRVLAKGKARKTTNMPHNAEKNLTEKSERPKIFIQ